MFYLVCENRKDGLGRSMSNMGIAQEQPKKHLAVVSKPMLGNKSDRIGIHVVSDVAIGSSLMGHVT